MPTYQYECLNCKKEFEQFQKMNDKPLDTCLLCGKKGKVKRLIGTGAGIIFKGSGFYETDYKRKSGSTDSKKSEAASTKTEKKQPEKTETKKKE
ncbi:MAG TPA: zinc ribbon domain-containing protein [Victivallales bacterium]|nr:zinc ribbon domain-containing protein [Victivallales bacterium]HRR28872.1 zinc ribbon domain-containing protein [Victivallales bacterium]HRU01034.1 zinc ribbon domain-containing protein [Victivallales bacterium]